MSTKAEILKSIRRKCIDCCAGQLAEVRLRQLQHCDLWRYRLGVDPDPARTGFAKISPSGRVVFDKKGGGSNATSTLLIDGGQHNA